MGTRKTTYQIMVHVYKNDLADKVFTGDPKGPVRKGVDVEPGLRFEDLDEPGFEYGAFATDAPFAVKDLTPEEYAAAASKASDEAKEVAESIRNSIASWKQFPAEVQNWFKDTVAKGPPGISEIIKA